MTSLIRGFSNKMGGVFTDAMHDQGAKTELKYKNYTIVFDSYTNYVAADSINLKETSIRVYVSFASIDDFRFEIFNESLFDTCTKLFGAQDIKIEVLNFDKKFIIKSNDTLKIKKLLEPVEIKQDIIQFKKIHLQIGDQKGIWGTKLPRNQLELSLFSYVVEDIKVLASY